MTPQQEARSERLIRLRSYQTATEAVQTALKIHFVGGIPLEDAMSLAGVRNIARTIESPRVQAVLSDMAPTVDDLMADEPAPAPPAPAPPAIGPFLLRERILGPKFAQEAPSQPLQATAEPEPAPEPARLPPLPKEAYANMNPGGMPCHPATVCRNCHRPALGFLDGHAYCPEHFKVAYWAEDRTIKPPDVAVPKDVAESFQNALQAEEAKIERHRQAQIDANPHNSMEKVFPALARMATREENERAWAEYDAGQQAERESLVAEALAQERQAREERARKIQQGWRF